ncbi:hypothetical protein ACFFQW_19015 [Umezawaea endophytica]|uniref:Uncharacterized protein n=1 Tax=Umezawaea endophytica TaxID=1654476 RepID=A0A9X2VPL9_9PSEU|nr:hypothetical protein [Umezawaea endophytica]MCS7479842.1 hypothetical protein [Umezawaea endophytica]
MVTVGTPVPRRRQEQARALCLNSLVRELHGFGVDAGAVRAAKQGRADLLDVLAECVHEVDVVTDC